MNTRITRFVLGAADPEMSAIEALCRGRGIEVIKAAAPGRDGVPTLVGGPSTYKATTPTPLPGDVWVETAPAAGGKAALKAAGAVLVDHHEPGDPGYGKPPAEAFEASSLGQVLSLLGIAPTQADRVVAACDHCLTAAYAGLVPGVTQNEVVAARVSSAAAFERRPPSQLEDEIETALAELENAPVVTIGGVKVVDLRSFAPPAADPNAKSDRGGVAGLNHAGPMSGRAYLALIREKTGKVKVVLGGDGPGTATKGYAAAGFKSWADAQGYTGSYGGDPARGFAGAYEKE